MSFRYWLDSTALRSALLAGAAALAASCGGDNDPNGPPDPSDPGDPPAVDAVALAPTTVGLAVGQKSRLIATVHAADGTVLTDRTVTWSSRDAGVATVADGEVTAVTEGSVEITASSEGKTGLATVTVFGEGDGRTRTWKGGAGGAPTLWSRAANWTPSGRPIPLDTAVIAAADVSAILDVDATVAGLVIKGGSLRIAGFTLVVRQPQSLNPLTIKIDPRD